MTIRTIQNELLHLQVATINEPEAYFESALQLSADTLLFLSSLHPATRIGWLASRYLLSQMTQVLPPPIRKEGKKPYLTIAPGYVGISHTQEYVAIGICERNIGVDIQMLNPKLHKVAPRFMNAAELAEVSPTHVLEHLAVMWSAKESLYKMYNNPAVDYRKELLIEPFQYNPQGGTCVGYIPLNNQCDYRIQFNYQQINDDAVLVYGHE